MKILFSLVVLLAFFITSCVQNDAKKKYGHLFREGFKGEPFMIETFNYVYDSSGTLKPDSISHETGRWKDGYLVYYKDFDTIRNNYTEAEYRYTDSGRLAEMIVTNKAGRLVQLSRMYYSGIPGKSRFVTYDSAHQITAQYTGLEFDENGGTRFAKEFDKDSILRVKFTNKVYTGGEFSDSTNIVRSRLEISLTKTNDPEKEILTILDSAAPQIVIKQFGYPKRDSLNNWLERVETDSSGKVQRVSRRIIQYARVEE